MVNDVGKLIHLDTTSEHSKRELYNFLKSLPEGQFSVKIDTYKRLATPAQRGYYRGYLLPEVSLISGYETDEVHLIATTLFLKEDKQIGNFRVEVIKSTSTLTTAEAEMYYSRFRRWAYDTFGVTLRLPNEYGPLTYTGI